MLHQQRSRGAQAIHLLLPPVGNLSCQKNRLFPILKNKKKDKTTNYNGNSNNNNNDNKS